MPRAAVRKPFLCRPFLCNPGLCASGLVLASSVWGGPSPSAADETWSCPVTPAESQVVDEPGTGARTVFVTTSPADDSNLYFHDRSWLTDESMLIFTSDRTGRREPFGYVERTGEIVRLCGEGGAPVGGVTCGRRSNVVYGIRGSDVVQLRVEVAPGVVSGELSRVTAHAKKVAEIPRHGGLRSALSESSDGRRLAVGYVSPDDPEVHRIAAIEVETGKVVTIAEARFPISHVQWSWTRPDLILFARTYPEGDRVPEDIDPAAEPRSRVWLVDLSGRPAWPVFPQKPDELVTHECWWTEERFTFCGGHHPHESHLKVYDLRTQRISILGAGSWWPGGSAAEIAKRAWWHASGSPDGRWAAADTFHGDIVLFDAATSEERPLSDGHRAFGSGGAHPHVGWGPSSDRVVYTSNKRGNPDVVVTYVPKAWR